MKKKKKKETLRHKAERWSARWREQQVERWKKYLETYPDAQPGDAMVAYLQGKDFK